MYVCGDFVGKNPGAGRDAIRKGVAKDVDIQIFMTT